MPRCVFLATCVFTLAHAVTTARSDSLWTAGDRWHDDTRDGKERSNYHLRCYIQPLTLVCGGRGEEGRGTSVRGYKTASPEIERARLGEREAAANVKLTQQTCGAASRHWSQIHVSWSSHSVCWRGQAGLRTVLALSQNQWKKLNLLTARASTKEAISAGWLWGYQTNIIMD